MKLNTNISLDKNECQLILEGLSMMARDTLYREYEEIYESCLTLIRKIRSLEDNDSKEPLIKEEKIRKAVKAWAEVNGVKEVTVARTFTTYTFFPTDTCKVDITVWTEPSLSNLSKDKTYSIIELCGEEEHDN